MTSEDVPAQHVTCPQCGCLVGDQQAHGDWHRGIRAAQASALTLEAMLDAAAGVR